MLVRDPSDKQSGKAPSPEHGLARQGNDRTTGLKKSGGSANLRKADDVLQESGDKSGRNDQPLASSPGQKMLHKESSDDDGEPYIQDDDDKD